MYLAGRRGSAPFKQAPYQSSGDPARADGTTQFEKLNNWAARDEFACPCPDMLTEVRRLRPKAAKLRRLVGGSRARDCFEVVISHERAWRTDHAIVRLPAPIFGRSTLQPYRLARHDVATLEMRSSSRETRLRTPIALYEAFVHSMPSHHTCSTRPHSQAAATSGKNPCPC